MSRVHKDLTRRTRGLMEIPSEEVPTSFRCIALQIPDSDAAVRQLLGQLYQLTYWTNYARDSAHSGAAWARAWANAIRQNAPLGDCSMIQLRACTLDCGIEYSTDGGDTWTCISLANCIDDIARGVIQDLIDDGTLQRPGGPYPPVAPPPVGECHTYHVKLEANQTWISPSPVSVGDTVQITNAVGGWNDGGVYWYCADGNSYGLGTCTPATAHHEGTDPSGDAYHMQPVLYLPGANVWLDPNSLVAMPGGTVSQNFILQANDQSLTDNSGNIEFDVTICTNAGWYHEFDFRTGQHGWTIDPDAELGAMGEYVAGVGFRSIRWSPHYESLELLYPAVDDRYHLQQLFTGYCDATSGGVVSVSFFLSGDQRSSDLPSAGGAFSLVRASIGTGHATRISSGYDAYVVTGGRITIETLALWGNGTDPYA